ncbi:MAG: hypothetical protein P4L36_10620 [Holophaga sp.]|nr:hypothetical protein [Holophaga sp.]
MARLFGFPALVFLVLVGCGGASGPALTVVPEPRTVVVGDQLALSALSTTDLASDLDWQVEEPFGGGLRNSQGESTVYFAPEAAGVYHLILRATTVDGHKLKQTVAIRVLPMVTVEPARAQVALGGSVIFSVASKGLARPPVKWSVDEADGGIIDQEGRYLPPAKAGTYHVTAVSTSDSQVSARATVVVGG